MSFVSLRAGQAVLCGLLFGLLAVASGLVTAPSDAQDPTIPDPFGEPVAPPLPATTADPPPEAAADDPFADYVIDRVEAERERDRKTIQAIAQRAAELIRDSIHQSSALGRDQIVLHDDGPDSDIEATHRKVKRLPDAVVAPLARSLTDNTLRTDRQLFDDAFSLLQYRRATGGFDGRETIEVFRALAEHDWGLRDRTQEPADVVRRVLDDDAPAPMKQQPLGCVVPDRIVHFRERWAKATDEPWPLDWRLDAARWKSVAETSFASLQDDDPAAAWKSRAALDSSDASFCAAAYLGVLTARQTKQIDRSLINRFVSDAASESERIKRLVQAYVAVIETGLEPDDFVRTRLRDRLLQTVETADAESLFRAVFELGRAYRVSAEDDASALARIMLVRAETDVFVEFREAAGLPRPAMYALFLTKPCTAKSAPVRPQKLLRDLAEEVDLPLWFDEAIAGDERELHFAARGPWWEVFTEAVENCGYEVALFDEWIIWVGPPQRRASAAALVRESRGKISGDSASAEYAKQKLAEPTFAEFTETPLQDVSDLLQDLHQMPFIVESRGSDRPITMNLRRLPLHVTLSLLADRNKLAWETAEGTTAIGSKEWTADFVRMSQQHRLAALSRSLRNDNVSAELAKVTVLEFIETPLQHVADYLSDLHSTSVVVDRGLAADTPITFRMQGGDLAWSLSMMCFCHGLAWCDDGEAVYLCQPERLDFYRALGAALAERRKHYPKALGEKLLKPVKLEFSNTLGGVAGELESMTGTAITLDQSGKIGGGIASRSVSATSKELPLDLHLTLIAEELGIDWVIRGDKILFREKSPMQNE